MEKYKQHVLLNDERGVSVRGFFSQSGLKNRKTARIWLSDAIEDWIAENDSKEYCFFFLKGRLYRSRNDGQFVTPKSGLVGSSGFTSQCCEEDTFKTI